MLNDDQIVALNRQYRRGCKWSDNTITKALRLKMSCGSSGYKELLNQNTSAFGTYAQKKTREY